MACTIQRKFQRKINAWGYLELTHWRGKQHWFVLYRRIIRGRKNTISRVQQVGGQVLCCTEDWPVLSYQSTREFSSGHSSVSGKNNRYLETPLFLFFFFQPKRGEFLFFTLFTLPSSSLWWIDITVKINNIL